MGCGSWWARRILQGIGGAMMVPVGRLVLLRSVERSELVSAMTWLMVPATIGPVLGPPVGGFLVTALSWRWIFYINVPIGALGIFLASRYIKDIKEAGRVDFDAAGLVLSGISLSCLMFGLELASRGETNLLATVAIVGAGIGTGALYLRHSRRHPQPVLDFRLMRVRDLRSVRDRRRADADFRRGGAILAADDAATRLRHVGAAEWTDHLHQQRRVPADEGRGTAHPAAMGFPAGDDVEWRHCHSRSWR